MLISPFEPVAIQAFTNGFPINCLIVVKLNRIWRLNGKLLKKQSNFLFVDLQNGRHKYLRIASTNRFNLKQFHCFLSWFFTEKAFHPSLYFSTRANCTIDWLLSHKCSFSKTNNMLLKEQLKLFYCLCWKRGPSLFDLLLDKTWLLMMYWSYPRNMLNLWS